MTVGLKEIGFKSFEKALNEFPELTQKIVGAATLRNALEMKRKTRAQISSGKYKINEALTAAIKGGSKALVGTPGANLWNSVAHDQTAWNRATVGVKRVGTWKGKNYDIALIVHNGMTIKVTRPMRDLFWNIYLVIHGMRKPEVLTGRAWELYMEIKKKKNFEPLGLSKKFIVIPPRPYLVDTFTDPVNIKDIRDRWKDSVKKVLEKMATMKGG